MIDRICAFLNVQPGDIMEYVPDPMQNEKVSSMIPQKGKRAVENTHCKDCGLENNPVNDGKRLDEMETCDHAGSKCSPRERG
jgi:hypothetical protein